MADLLDRLLGNLAPEESSLSVNPTAMLAGMREVQRGRITRAQLVTALSLTAQDQVGFDIVYTKMFVAPTTLPVNEFTDLFALGTSRNRADATGMPFYSKATIKTRLGL